jgi:hypothetical protein
MAFHTLAFPLWIVVPILGFYAYQHPLEYSSTSDVRCLRLLVVMILQTKMLF